MATFNIENLGCFGKARLIVEQNREAIIYEVETLIEGEESVVHAYVLLGDLVLNQDVENLSKDMILKKGKDVTKRVLKTPWNML